MRVGSCGKAVWMVVTPEKWQAVEKDGLPRHDRVSASSYCSSW
jgi:hypothetical protein